MHMDTPTATDKLIARKEGAIGWVIFNNPQKRNAMSLEMYEATAVAMESYAKDPEVRVVILKGEGDKAFISGADISQFKDRRGTLEQVRAGEVISEGCNRAIRECPKPVIAMIRGYCMGGGAGIAVATCASLPMTRASASPRRSSASATGFPASGAWPSSSARRTPPKFSIPGASSPPRRPCRWAW
jgi:1,4-dihydroxy-2-naphthoyl-CoA synthase